jgi:hypothetical protein
VTLTGRRERVRGVALAVCDDGVAATSSVECGRRAVAAVHGHPCISRFPHFPHVISWRAASRAPPECRPGDTHGQAVLVF